MFATGDKVILVDDKWPAWIAMYDNIPVKNRTYTVRDVRLGRPNIKNPQADENNTEVAITLEGVTNGPDPLFEGGLVELAFRADRFRKVEDIREEQSARRQKEAPLKQGTFF
jgi:hypothetical protein